MTDIAGDVVSQEAKTEAKVLIDRLIETLETRTESHEDERTVADSETKDDSKSFWNEVERATGIRRTEESVELVDGHNAKEDYVTFVSYLFEKGYLTQNDIPFGKGRKRCVLNSEKQHKDGDNMYNTEEIADDVFLETHNNTDFKKRRIVELGEKARERYS